MRSLLLKQGFTLVLTLFLFIQLSNQAQGEELNSDGEARYYYVGQVGSGYAIQMELVIDSEDVTGSYFHDNKGIPLSLSGTLSLKDSTVKLEEKGDKGRITGIFKGKLTSKVSNYAKTIEGDWSKPGGGSLLPFKLTKVADYTGSTVTQGAKIEASYLYPNFLSKDPAHQKINTILKEEMKTDQNKFIRDAKEFISENASSENASSEYASSGGWQQSLSYSVEYYSDELISLTGEVYSYTGGAHGNTYYVSSNYKIGAGRASPIKLSDLFKQGSGYMKVLSNYCVNDLLLKGAGWIVSADIKSFNEKDLGVFAVSPRGIKFAFAPYAVGPYAEGSYFVIVPLKELRGIINPDGPLSQFLELDSK